MLGIEGLLRVGFQRSLDDVFFPILGLLDHIAFLVEKARLAIENRRCVARSANTGKSGFFNQKGDVLQATKYWEEDVIKATLKANTEKTFYTRHGDYLYRIAVWMTFGLLLVTMVLTISTSVRAKRRNPKAHRPKGGNPTRPHYGKR